MENFQRGDDQSSTIYSTAHSAKHSWGTNTALAGGNSETLDLDAFHTVRFEWSEASLSFFVDGQPTWSLPRPEDPSNYEWPYHKPHFALLNLAIGGNGVLNKEPPAGSYPLTYTIDYISIAPLLPPRFEN